MIFRLGNVKSSNNQIYYYKQISNGKSIPFGIFYCLQQREPPAMQVGKEKL